MSNYLSALIPSSVVAWYPLADVTSAVNIVTVTDASGNGRDLVADVSNPPAYVLNAIEGRPVIRSTSTTVGLTYTPPSGSFTVRDMAILTKYVPTSGSVFSPSRGLVSNTSVNGSYTNPLLLGLNNTGRFNDYDPPSPSENAYRLDWTLLDETAMTAPINTWGLIQYSIDAGQTFSTTLGLKIANDRDFSPIRPWQGDIAEMMFFSTVLTADERRRVKLYFDLKFSRWKSDSTALQFPDPLMTGINYSRYNILPRDYTAVTVSHVYEDEGRSFNETGTPPKKWEVEFTGLSKAEAQIFNEFYDAARMVNSFSFLDKDGVTNTGVRVEAYDRTHSDHRSWDNSVKFTLAKY